MNDELISSHLISFFLSSTILRQYPTCISQQCWLAESVSSSGDERSWEMRASKWKGSE